MAHWKPLPQELEPEVRLLIERLRELKDRSGLSLVSLAGRTAYSKSSWERYLNGKMLPTQQAVRALGRLTEEDVGRLDALWASAELIWSRRGAPSLTQHPAEGAAQAEVERAAVPAEVHSAAEDPPTEPGQSTGRPPAVFPAPGIRRFSSRRRVLWSAMAGSALAVSLGLVWVSLSGASTGGSGSHASASAAGGGILLSSACMPVVSMGQNDNCVREVQKLLARHGAKLAIDGDFGPETSRRVTVFQVLAGLPDNGVVDRATATVLYSKKVSMTGWSPQRIEKRIREVFSRAPDEAVAIARCQSFLDPLYELPNADGTRNWGVFQISDGRLAEFGGTPRKALDPEWNIHVAYKLWQQHHGFSDWMFCEGAYASASPSPHHT